MVEQLKLAVGALQGLAHESRGEPCQDSVSACRAAHAACVALCDGAGSVPGSERVSEAVARALASLAAERFERLWTLRDAVLRDLIVSAGTAAALAAAPEVRPACTVLLAAMSDDGRCLVCHLGDGAVLAVPPAGGGRLLSAPENGESLSRTFFLSGPEPRQHLRVYRPEAEALLLCSDGVSPRMYERSGAASPAVGKMVGWLRSGGEAHAEALIGDALRNVFRSQSADDLSLAILLRAPRPAENETEEQS